MEPAQGKSAIPCTSTAPRPSGPQGTQNTPGNLFQPGAVWMLTTSSSSP